MNRKISNNLLAVVALSLLALFVFSAGCTIPITPEIDIQIPSTQTQPEKVYYTISFDSAGGSPIATQYVESGRSLSPPSTPIKSGSTFSGWYTSKSYVQEWSFSSPITGNVVLYAKWVQNTPDTAVTPITPAITEPDTSSDLNGRDLDYAQRPKIKKERVFIEKYEKDGYGYAVYRIATISEASIAPLSNPSRGQSEIVLDVGYVTFESISEGMKTITSYISETSQNKVTQTTESWNVGDISVSVGSVKIGMEPIYSHDTVTTESWKAYSKLFEDTERSYNKTTTTAKEIKQTSPYKCPNPNLYYRVALLGTYEVYQVFVVNLETKKITSFVYTVAEPYGPWDLETSTNSLFDYSKLVYPEDLCMNSTDADLSNYLNYQDSGKGYGTSESPYLIANAKEFLRIYEEPDRYYRLVNDIDLSGSKIITEVEFTGHLDGDRHVIQELNVNILSSQTYSEEKNFGLFAINSGTIQDITLKRCTVFVDENKNIEHMINAGVIAGTNSERGIIKNVNVEGPYVSVHRLNSNMGGIVGVNKGEIIDCRVEEGLIYGNGNGGGVAGTTSGKITSCTVIGNGVGRSQSEYEQYHFLYYYGTHAKKGGDHKGWGGIAGVAEKSSFIRDVTVDQLFVHCFFAKTEGAPQSYIGYVIGYNKGSLSGKNVGRVTEKRLGDYSGYVKKYYLHESGSEGHIGRDESSNILDAR